MNRTSMLAVLALVVVLLAGALLVSCAPAPPPSPEDEQDVAGFWTGLWQGFILLFTFVISLFDDDVGIYETVNNGNWYNFGYLLGVMLFFGGSGGGAGAGGRGR